jgi:hypothetical protein
METIFLRPGISCLYNDGLACYELRDGRSVIAVRETQARELALEILANWGRRHDPPPPRLIIEGRRDPSL